MKFTRDQISAVTIRRVEPGGIQIGERHFERTVVVTAEEVLPDWRGPALGELGIDHLEAILDTDPEVLVLGTGWKAAFPPRELTFAMARRGIGFEVMDTPAACRTFNILVAEGRRPAAILMID